MLLTASCGLLNWLTAYVHRLKPLLLCNHTVVEEFRRLALRLRLLDSDAIPAATLASRASADVQNASQLTSTFTVMP